LSEASYILTKKLISEITSPIRASTALRVLCCRPSCRPLCAGGKQSMVTACRALRYRWFLLRFPTLPMYPKPSVPSHHPPDRGTALRKSGSAFVSHVYTGENLQPWTKLVFQDCGRPTFPQSSTPVRLICGNIMD